MPAQKDDTAAKTNEAANGEGANGGENTLTPEQTERIEEIRATLTERKVDFKETDTLEDLEETLKLSDETIAKANAKEEKDKDKNKGKDAKEEKKVKAPEERILDRRTKRLQDKADREDTIPVYCTHATSYGPRLVVVDMPRVDAAAFGDSVTETKLKVGTRVDKHGKALKEGQILDEEDEAYSPKDEE